MAKIGLIGDIHFGEFARSNEFCPDGFQTKDKTKGIASLKEGLIQIFSEEKLNYLLVAGDLTSKGNPIEFVECYKLINEIAEKAGIPKQNVIISLGNHDVDWKITDITNNISSDITTQIKLEELYQIISSNIASLLIDNNNFTETGPIPFSGIYRAKDIDLFVLNSGWLSNRKDKIKHGKLEEKQLIWFEKMAQKYNNTQNWKILLLHHHPISYPHPYPHHDISAVQEGSELIQVAGKYGFNLICHGHRHHPKAYNDLQNEWVNPITFVCVGSFSVDSIHRCNGDIPNCFHILNLSDTKEKIIHLKNYEYSSKNGWKAIKENRPEAPLDAEMYFSRPYDLKSKKDKLRKIVAANSTDFGANLPGWNDLPIELRTVSYNTLNDFIKNEFSSEYDMVGLFPEPVILLRRSI